MTYYWIDFKYERADSWVGPVIFTMGSVAGRPRFMELALPQAQRRTR